MNRTNERTRQQTHTHTNGKKTSKSMKFLWNITLNMSNPRAYELRIHRKKEHLSHDSSSCIREWTVSFTLLVFLTSWLSFQFFFLLVPAPSIQFHFLFCLEAHNMKVGVKFGLLVVMQKVKLPIASCPFLLLYSLKCNSYFIISKTKF